MYLYFLLLSFAFANASEEEPRSKRICSDDVLAQAVARSLEVLGYPAQAANALTNTVDQLPQAGGTPPDQVLGAGSEEHPSKRICSNDVLAQAVARSLEVLGHPARAANALTKTAGQLPQAGGTPPAPILGTEQTKMNCGEIVSGDAEVVELHQLLCGCSVLCKANLFVSQAKESVPPVAPSVPRAVPPVPFAAPSEHAPRRDFRQLLATAQQGGYFLPKKPAAVPKNATKEIRVTTCGFLCVSSSSESNHLRTCLREDCKVERQLEITFNYDKDKKLICPFCGFKCEEKSGVWTHLNAHQSDKTVNFLSKKHKSIEDLPIE